jgi:Flp pilus assembly protein TadG
MAIEFAFILPVMLIMYFGTFEASRLVRVYMTANRSAGVIANLVAQKGVDGVTAADISDFCSAAKLAMAPFPGTALKATIASVTKNVSSGTVAFDWQNTSCGGGAGTFTDATTASSGIVVNKGDTAIIVKISYNYTAPVHFVLPSSYTITQTAYQRPRSGGSIPQS